MTNAISPRRGWVRTLVLVSACWLSSSATFAQYRTSDPNQRGEERAGDEGERGEQQAPVPQPTVRPEARTNQAGRIGRSAVGEVGQRQTRYLAPAGREPLARIDNRISNRVQNRLRQRIDRYYTPSGDAAAAIADAETRTRTRRGNR